MQNTKAVVNDHWGRKKNKAAGKKWKGKGENCIKKLGDQEVTANIYSKSRNLPIQLRKTTVQICDTFWDTQYCMVG